ncbi:MAG: response regulator [Mariprofundaceae bacterium]|nr:response regulator [Mariprofundaceae bacterium]
MLFHVIDDQPFFCAFLEGVLDSLGHESISFTSPEDYLAYIESHAYRSPDAIFCDIRMPVMSGYELMNRTLAIWPDKKFVLMSGGPEVRARYEPGVYRLLHKPLELPRLEELVLELTELG